MEMSKHLCLDTRILASSCACGVNQRIALEVGKLLISIVSVTKYDCPVWRQ